MPAQSDTVHRPAESAIEDATARPVFLLSSERSGSNLVRSILNTHSDVSAPHPIETAYPWEHTRHPAALSPAKRRKLIRDVVINKRYSFHPLTVPVDIGRANALVESADRPNHVTIQQGLYEVISTAEGTSMWVSKYPGLWEWLDDLDAHYAEPNFVYLVRDVRDVALSFKTSNIELYHPYFSANRWRAEQRRGIDLIETSPESVHLVRYQDLLREPESVVRDVCDFLDIEFEERMLYYYETEDAQATSESSELLENLSVPIKSDNYDKFRDRLPDEEVRIVEKIAREELEYFGFDPVYERAELEDVELDEERFARLDRRMERRAQIRYWRETPVEQIKRQMTRSFAGYMALRYGVFG